MSRNCIVMLKCFEEAAIYYLIGFPLVFSNSMLPVLELLKIFSVMLNFGVLALFINIRI